MRAYDIFHAILVLTFIILWLFGVDIALLAFPCLLMAGIGTFFLILAHRVKKTPSYRYEEIRKKAQRGERLSQEDLDDIYGP